MNEIEKALSKLTWVYESCSEKYSRRVADDHNFEQYLSALNIAISALRAQLEREKGCEYCNGRFGIAAHHINDAGLQSGTNKIANFCPMCGRKLKEKTHDEI